MSRRSVRKVKRKTVKRRNIKKTNRKYSHKGGRNYKKSIRKKYSKIYMGGGKEYKYAAFDFYNNNIEGRDNVKRWGRKLTPITINIRIGIVYDLISKEYTHKYVLLTYNGSLITNVTIRNDGEYDMEINGETKQFFTNNKFLLKINYSDEEIESMIYGDNKHPTDTLFPNFNEQITINNKRLEEHTVNVNTQVTSLIKELQKKRILIYHTDCEDRVEQSGQEQPTQAHALSEPRDPHRDDHKLYTHNLLDLAEEKRKNAKMKGLLRHLVARIKGLEQQEQEQEPPLPPSSDFSSEQQQNIQPEKQNKELEKLTTETLTETPSHNYKVYLLDILTQHLYTGKLYNPLRLKYQLKVTVKGVWNENTFVIGENGEWKNARITGCTNAKAATIWTLTIDGNSTEQEIPWREFRKNEIMDELAQVKDIDFDNLFICGDPGGR